MKKSFLLAGVILDIIVISLILITALNVINISSKTNSFIKDNKFDVLYQKAQIILEQITSNVEFHYVLNEQSLEDKTGVRVIPVKDTPYHMRIKLEPFWYKQEDKKEDTFIVYPLELNASSSMQKAVVDVLDDNNVKVLSIDKLIFN